MSFPIPKNEALRVEALRRYKLLDTAPEPAFDDFTLLASHICETPMALISLLDDHRQWFKSKVGLAATETPRSQAFCNYTILSNEMMVVDDATKDARFAENPLVLGDPNIRFYAGAPLTDPDGFCVGSLCVLDNTPRHLPPEKLQALQALGRQVMSSFRLRRVSFELADALENLKTLKNLMPICAHCRNVRNDEGYWKELTEYIRSQADVEFSHGICPDCVRTYHPEVYRRLVAKGKM